MQIGSPAAPFVPVDAQGRLDGPLIAVRWAGAALVVPVMEELFWRSFLMRWIQQFDLRGGRSASRRPAGDRALDLRLRTRARCGWPRSSPASQPGWLYRRTGKLWVAIVAHAVTNGALGIWVVATGNWAFW